MGLTLAWVSVVGAIWLLFEAMERTVKSESKKSAGEWLKHLDSSSAARTVLDSPYWFIQAFNSIFGEQHFTWRCVWRSWVASMVALVVVSSLWAAIDFSTFGDAFTPDFMSVFEWLGSLLIWVICWNFVLDYCSLIETRWVLSHCISASKKKLIIYLAADLILTSLIFLGPIFLLGLILYVIGGPRFPGEHWDSILWLTKALMGISDLGKHFKIYFYSTFFTSAWFYMFILSSTVIRLLLPLGGIINRVLAILDVENKPFQSMGIVLMFITSLGFAIAAIISAIV